MPQIGLGTALATILAGGTRGYRAQQEIQRQIKREEENRMLAERELQLRQRGVDLQEREFEELRKPQGLAQTKGIEATTRSTDYDTNSKQRREFRLSTPFARGPLRVGDMSFESPEDLMIGKDYLDYYRGSQGDRLSYNVGMAGVNQRDREAQLRVDNPEAFGGSRRPYLSAEDQFLVDLVKTLFGGGISDMEGLTPEKARMGLELRRNLALQTLRNSPILSEILSGIAGSDSVYNENLPPKSSRFQNR